MESPTHNSHPFLTRTYYVVHIIFKTINFMTTKSNRLGLLFGQIILLRMNMRTNNVLLA